MKKLLSVLLVLLAVSASAQTTIVGSGGGGSVASGSAISGCTAYSIVTIDASGNLACLPSSVVNGSASTAGRSILTIKDTATSGQAFWDITGTFPATLSGAHNGATLNFIGDNDAQIQRGLDLTVTTVDSAATKSTLRATLAGPGSASNSSYLAGEFISTYGSGSQYVSGAIRGTNSAAAAGHVFGVLGETTGAAAYGTGVVGVVSSGTNRYGTMGFASGGGTSNIAGYFGLTTTPSLPAGNAALISDNVAVAANIFEARDNGTAVFTIADGGAVTGTGSYNFSSAGAGILMANTGAIRWIGNNDPQFSYNTANTPDQAFLALGPTSYSYGIRPYSAYASDLNNGPCGTSACTDPTLIISPVTGTTTEYNALAAWGTAGGALKTLTESAATSVIQIPIANLAGAFGEFCYTVKAADATDSQIRGSCIKYTVTAKAGTETCTLNTQSATTSDASIIETEDGSGSGAITTGTLTYAITCSTTPSNAVDIQINAVSSLTQTTLNVTYKVNHVGPGQPARQ